MVYDTKNYFRRNTLSCHTTSMTSCSFRSIPEPYISAKQQKYYKVVKLTDETNVAQTLKIFGLMKTILSFEHEELENTLTSNNPYDRIMSTLQFIIRNKCRDKDPSFETDDLNEMSDITNLS